MDKQSFGARIATLRTAAGLSQEKLAARLGFQGTSRLGNYETGRNWFPVDQLSSLAEELGVSIAELFEEGDASGEQGRGPRDVVPASLPGHVVLRRLKGFDKPGGQDRIALPEIVLRQRVPRSDYGAVQWIINPTNAMSPRIAQGSVVLVDTEHTDLDHVMDGDTYAIRLWGRPEIRKIFVTGEDTIRLVGEREMDHRIELTRPDFSKLEIGGLVIDAI